ncbi:MAG: UbiA family prenyltransferase [Prosthecobacter sp.]|jgi:4-hydroxybenzoate polyprenyltransferase|uniref:UbiA family prenyltransferase n=1 Tax=Prosthecobacter sp. TaxID=1965333 RepID=UPI0019DFA452|nr:UbiA family prenyltransferase [Prosthecobacter sp.]MBE2284657.1 UbiA family prenyltransferase [Prosthecobacter sp.]
MKPWLQLARISNLPTVWTNVTAAWLLAGGEWADARLYWLIFAGSLLYTGGMILNDAADVKFDREHRQERPIPAGQVGLGMAWSVGGGFLAAGIVIACLHGAQVGTTLGLVAAILFYDLYHKPWAGSVLVMGACRALLYLMAASAASSVPGQPGYAVLMAALALGSYVVGITLAARLEHKQKGVLPLLSSLTALILLIQPGVLCVTRVVIGGGDEWQYLILIVFALWVLHALNTLRRGGPHIGRAVGLLLAGIAVVDALAVAAVSVPLALAFAALAPLLRLWQRWIAAT